MMFRKIILYIFFPVAAIILALFLLKEHSPFGAGNTSFASDPEREITSVELSTGNGRSEERRVG